MISKKIALKLLIGLLSIILIFHLFVLFEIISYKIVWAGKLKSKEEMYVFEAVSILINFFLIIVLYIKYRNIKKSETNRIINMIIWVFVFLFALNTLGNLFAENLIEQILGTLLTFISATLCWIIVKKKNKRNANTL